MSQSKLVPQLFEPNSGIVFLLSPQDRNHLTEYNHPSYDSGVLCLANFGSK
jgi:hypothetical protein